MASKNTNSQNANEKIAKEIIDLYRTYGSSDYIGENITQSQHAIQCGLFAKNTGADDILVFAAFLHDIGHLLGLSRGTYESMIYSSKKKKNSEDWANFGDKDEQYGFESENGSDNGCGQNMGIVDHEILSRDYLREMGMPDKMCELVGMHVMAKRYLCTVDDKYANEQLSEASKKTFELQGGKLSDEEVKMFENHEYFDDAIKLRHFDDEGKMENYPPKKDIMKHLDFFEKKIYLYLENLSKANLMKSLTTFN